MTTPTALTTIPRSIDEVDAEWLTAVMRGNGTLSTADSVTGVRRERIAVDTGFSSELYRVHLEGDAPLPASVIIKLPTSTIVRAAMDMIGGYVRELTFYRDLAWQAPIRSPRVYAVAMAKDCTDFILVLEDLAEWENENHYVGLPFARAQTCLRGLAHLHAWSSAPSVAARIDEAFPSLGDPVSRQVLPILFAEGWAVYQAHARTPVPPQVRDFAEHLAVHLGRILDVLTERNELIHGDIRADNLFFRGDEMAVVDYQLSARGSGLADVAYLVSQGLTPLERAHRDELLVGDYLTALTQAGAPDCSWNDAWRHYRTGVAYYLAFPVIALRGWDSLPDNARELCLRLVERSIATICDVDALGVLG